jgi:hypothetical protein
MIIEGDDQEGSCLSVDRSSSVRNLAELGCVSDFVYGCSLRWFLWNAMLYQQRYFCVRHIVPLLTVFPILWDAMYVDRDQELAHLRGGTLYRNR